MQRLALGLGLLLFCGAVAAEQVKPVKAPAATQAATADAAKKAPADAATAKADAAKKTAKKPKGPPAKEFFGTVTTPAPLAARPSAPMRRAAFPAASRSPSTAPTGR